MEAGWDVWLLLLLLPSCAGRAHCSCSAQRAHRKSRHGNTVLDRHLSHNPWRRRGHARRGAFYCASTRLIVPPRRGIPVFYTVFEFASCRVGPWSDLNHTMADPHSHAAPSPAAAASSSYIPSTTPPPGPAAAGPETGRRSTASAAARSYFVGENRSITFDLSRAAKYFCVELWPPLLGPLAAGLVAVPATKSTP